MNSLNIRMSDYGFESNTHYDFVLSALKRHFTRSIACLNIQGNSGRRKTAFANALANAQEDIPHILYYDFTQTEETPQPIVIDPEQEGIAEPAVDAFDRVMSDACAYSEAEKTILILDQLHEADFKQHIRIHDFLKTQEWSYQGTTFFANKQKLTVYLISEKPLYHSLQRQSYKVWIPPASENSTHFVHSDFGLDEDAQPMIDALIELFSLLNSTPTVSELAKIMHDVGQSIHTHDQLNQSLFGWVESIDYATLMQEDIQSVIQTRIMPRVEQYIGIEDIQL